MFDWIYDLYDWLMGVGESLMDIADTLDTKTVVYTLLISFITWPWMFKSSLWINSVYFNERPHMFWVIAVFVPIIAYTIISMVRKD